MKHLFLTGAILFSLGAVAEDKAAENATTNVEKATAESATSTDSTSKKSTTINGYNVTIDGMHCKSCSDNVKKELGKLPKVGAKNVQIVLKEKRATITLKKGATLSEEAIKKAVEEAGYTVTKIETI